MGGSNQKPKQTPPPKPQLTLPQRIKNTSRQLKKLQNNYKRQSEKYQRQIKKKQKQLEQIIAKDMPRQCQVSVAKQIMIQKKMQAKCQRMTVKIDQIIMNLNQVQTASSLSTAMSSIAGLLKQHNKSIKPQDIMRAMQLFEMQMQKGEQITNQLGEMMDEEEDLEENSEEIELIIKNANQKLDPHSKKQKIHS